MKHRIAAAGAGVQLEIRLSHEHLQVFARAGDGGREQQGRQDEARERDLAQPRDAIRPALS
ncbi:MAG: hypothetical protein E6K30_06470 [Gammaproteobacteria bacterium]|nr:MAG: hypothetical protein E6K30_06470 [Gammaproteobacteria bacterium]